MKLEEICPYCGGIGKYQKGWAMKQRKQVKGQPQGTYIETGKVTQIRLYKCKNPECKRNFRKGETIQKAEG